MRTCDSGTPSESCAGGIAWRATGQWSSRQWAAGVAWPRHPRRAARQTLVGGGNRCPDASIIDRKTVHAADNSARSSRAGWRQRNERRQAATPRRGCERHAGELNRRRHRRPRSRTRGRRTPTPPPLRGSLHHPAGWRRCYPDGCFIWAKEFSPLLCRSSKTLHGGHWFFQVRPPHLGSRENFGGSNKHSPLRAPTTQTRPDTRSMVHLAMITTMTRRLADLKVSNTPSRDAQNDRAYVSREKTVINADLRSQTGVTNSP